MIDLNNKKWQFFAIALLVFFSCQRFVFGMITSNVSIVALLFFFFLWHRPGYLIYFSMLSLILIVDKSSIAYPETHFIVKYSTYVIVLIAVLSLKNIGYQTVFFLLWSFFLISSSIASINEITPSVLVRDLIFLVSLLIIFTTFKVFTNEYKTNVVILLLASSLGMLLSELVNLLFFYHYDSGYYLSYSPFKVLVCLISLYFLISRQFFIFFVLFLLTMVVLVNLQTRMIFVFYLLCIVLITFRYFKDWILLFALVIVAFQFVPLDIFAKFRVLNIFYYLFETSDFVAVLSKLDPVRVTEHKLVFNRGILEVLFGDGPGVGIRDPNGLLSFVTLSDMAYSQEELRSQLYFRLHDAWVYITQRFGLIAYISLSLIAIKGFFQKNIDSEVQLISACVFLLLNLATYSSSGIILCFVLSSILIVKVAPTSRSEEFNSDRSEESAS